MSAELLVNVAPGETRAALVEEGRLQELQLERDAQRGLVGNLYKGRVVRVLPGMQAAFVDIRLARTGFLHAGDIAAVRGATGPAPRGTGAFEERADSRDEVAGAARERSAPRTSIQELLNQGDELLVQVIKDPIGGKGARLSSYVSLPSRLLVYMPSGTGIGISARIEAAGERERLRGLLAALAASQPAGGGYIVRTAAEGASGGQLAADVAYLQRLWQRVREQHARSRAGTLVHEELSLPLRLLRDELTESVQRVCVDSAPVFERMRAFAAEFMPQALPRIECHVDAVPLFDRYGIEAQIGQALERKVALACGGYLVIDQTEALTSIDVNTGAYVGQDDLEETSLRTNREAAREIARQLRLRNIGGIIVIDFIDMRLEEHRQQLLAEFQAALAADRVRSQLAGVSSLGLVEMTRKRIRESLGRLLCEPCSACDARGFRKSAETVGRELCREVLQRIRPPAPLPAAVLAHPQVIEWLEQSGPSLLARLSDALGRPLQLMTQALNTVEHYEIVYG